MQPKIFWLVFALLVICAIVLFGMIHVPASAAPAACPKAGAHPVVRIGDAYIELRNRTNKSFLRLRKPFKLTVSKPKH